MQLDRVTITGADNSIRPEDLLPLSEQYPFVEWGILLSRSQEGVGTRFPSREWMQDLSKVAEKNSLRLAGHLCGAWVRELAEQGRFAWLEERPELVRMFQRVQLNFHAIPHKPHPDFYQALSALRDTQIIFQMDGENEDLFHGARPQGIDSVPLFDLSHGAGVLPKDWPLPIDDVYCGYAGGLGPDTLEAQLQKIDAKVGDSTIWIDMETRVRSNADRLFDLDKVSACLNIAQQWVSNTRATE